MSRNYLTQITLQEAMISCMQLIPLFEKLLKSSTYGLPLTTVTSRFAEREKVLKIR